MTTSGFGWVVDDSGGRKRELGGALKFAEALADGTLGGPCEPGACPTCGLLDEPLGCAGVIEAPLSAATERWLMDGLPASAESLAARLLRQNLKEGAVRGAGGEALRKAGLCTLAKPLSHHYGPFFRGFSVTSDQLLEELFCAGDVQPPHALAVLMHVGVIAIDGARPEGDEGAAALAAVVEEPRKRRDRTTCLVKLTTDDDRSLTQLKRYLRGLWAAFVLDTEVRVVG